MNKDQAWKNIGNGNFLQWDFAPHAHWTRERLALEQRAIIAVLEEPGISATGQDLEWLHLARRLPDALRSALIAELRNGNQIAGIGSSGWPNDGSVVVTLEERFSAARRAAPPGVVWRELNDPHYYREDVSQEVDGVAFLLIT